MNATFEVVTPLFLGGADPSRTIELRAPSVKGALRFWWRALAWGRHGGDLQAIREEEQKIFGAAGDEHSRLGQASFALRARWLAEPNRLAEAAPRSLTFEKPGASYLSYGIINRGQEASPRPCYQPGGRFELMLHTLRRADNESGFHPSLLAAIKLFGLLGGLGGRSRRGWGSVALIGLGGEDGVLQWRAPQDLDQYRHALSSIFGSTADTPEAGYSAFDKGARLQVFGVGADALAVLDRLGQVYQACRREPANRSFIFGLPHSRYKGHADRRASPLLFHVHKLSGQYAVAATFLRAPFLEQQPLLEEYMKIDSFLNQLPTRLKTRKLTQAFAILPGGASA